MLLAAIPMHENLVRLQHGSGPGVVFVHPGSGLATAFRRLVPHLSDAGDLFAFENPEPQGEPCSIAELAAGYWEQLSGEVVGSLAFVGWSFGGAVATELATLAEQAGHDVLCVLLLDAATPHMLRSSTATPMVDLGGLFGIDPSELQGVVVTSEAQILEALVTALRRTRGSFAIEAADLKPFVHAYQWHRAVARRPWMPPGHSAPVCLCRARDEHGWDDSPTDLGWGATCRVSPALRWVPGTHHSMMSEENAPELARVVSSLIDQARRERSFTADAGLP